VSRVQHHLAATSQLAHRRKLKMRESILVALNNRRTRKTNISEVLELAGLVIANTSCDFPMTQFHIGVDFVAVS